MIADFDGGAITSDADALLLGAADRAIRLTECFAACFNDRRSPDHIKHDVLAALCAAGHGVILSTHMLGTIGDDCSEILFLGNGTCTHRWSRADIAAARQTPGGLDAMVVNALESA
uniref:transposase n=1 Tax=Acidiphilium acidophilum TaxID=76588 RepID=UPI00386C261B